MALNCAAHQYVRTTLTVSSALEQARHIAIRLDKKVCRLSTFLDVVIPGGLGNQTRALRI
jgi:hypothetical protein